MAMQDDTDDTGDVISFNGNAVDTPDTDEPTGAEDRGDTVAGTEAVDPPAATDPEPSAAHRPQHIPKARFDEVNSRKNELALENESLQAELAQFRAGKPAAAAPAVTPDPEPPAFDEDAKEREYIEAMIDGDRDLAASLRSEINRHIRAETRREFEDDTNQRATAQSLQQASNQAVADFPYLDTPDGAEALDLIIASRDARVARGVPAPEALSQAVASIAPRFKPTGTETPGSVLPTDPPRSDTRTRDALKRGAADSHSQPPVIQDGSGGRALAARVNVAELTEEQFDELTPAEKKRLRGD
jgi:hypothetical protein